MRVLTVPNWSFGRDSELLRKFGSLLDASDLRVHYLKSDADHNRTVSAFSGESDVVFQALMSMASEALPRIDLNRHSGVHPRVGALDVCPFVLPEGSTDLEPMKAAVEEFADGFAKEFEVPVFLYEKSEKGRHEADLPTLRRGGFGALLTRELNPDYGPSKAHPHCGVTVMGVRDFLIAMNVNLVDTSVEFAKGLGAKIRGLRREGDPRFLGVRALGFLLPSQGVSQVSLNVTLPDVTPVDPIIEWVLREASDNEIAVAGTELIGVIRKKDLATSTRLPVQEEQVVEGW